jgi:hypothetical protein
MHFAGLPTKTVARWATALCLLVLLLFSIQSRAQVAGTANIKGTVADASGAVIPNAEVTLTEQNTGVSHKAKSGGDGVFIFTSMPVGTYSVTITSQGFKTYVQKGIVLEVGSAISVNAAMAVGAADVKVEVEAEGLSLQTEDPSFKQTVDERDITEMPLNSSSRQITGLLAISGGANIAPSGDFTGSKYSYQTISISIAGGGGNTTIWRLDGGDNQDYMGNGNLPFPFPDAVSQFSVESTALGAQEGSHPGGYVNAVTRSGTNVYHGSAFEFIRNNYIDSTNFFSISPDRLHQNEFGGTFGGPIKKDKLFAFAGYQRLIYNKSQSNTTAYVPTAANLSGDFSTTFGSSCNTNNTPSNANYPLKLYDPLTGTQLSGYKYASTPTFNAASLALTKYLPTTSDSCGKVSYAIPLQQTDNEFVTRVDYNINARHNFYARYFIDGYQAPAFYSPTNILITTQSGNWQRTQSFTAAENWNVATNLVNSAHVTVMRRRNNRGYSPSDINASNLGITLYQAVPNGLQISEGKFTIGGGTNSVAHFNDNTLTFDDDVTWIKGKHQMALGGEWVQNELNILNSYEANGTFTFNGTYSGSGPNGGAAVGDMNLDFLMGTLSAFQQSKYQQNALRGAIPSLYGQDTFHATKKLTLVAGLRWGPNFMPVDYFNRGSLFDYNKFMANTVSTVYPNAPAGFMFYGDQGVPRAFTQNSPWQFSPNIGGSYDPVGNGKWVIRAGAELMYDKPNFFTGQRTQQNPPFATAISNTQTSGTGPVMFNAPWSVGSITTSPFPQPSVPTPSQAKFYAQSQYIVMTKQFHAPYTIQWTMSVQHEFGRGWQAQLDYIGNTTRHGPLGTPMSPAVYIPGVWGAGGTGCTGIVTSGAAAVTPGAAGTNCSTTKNYTSRYALTIANPAQGNQVLGGGSGSIWVGDSGTANYNGLVASLNHRLSNTFSLLANWTWSKCLDIEDAQGDYASVLVENPNNPRMDYGPCGSDYRHVENATLISRSNFTHGNRLARLAINDWEFAPLFHIMSGAPFTVTSGQDNSLTNIGYDRPNQIASNAYSGIAIHKASGATTNQYLNTAAFAQVTAPCGSGSNIPGCAYYGTYGNIGRNSFRGPKYFQFDGQVSRQFHFWERSALTLRLEAFNVLNHPNFAVPSSLALSSSTFGYITGTASGSTARQFQGSAKITF